MTPLVVQEYEIVIEELVDGKWQGFTGHTDVQVRVMLRPYWLILYVIFHLFC